MAERHEPVRTCIGCRQRAPRAELVRLVAQLQQDDTTIVVRDEAKRLPGRGAWLHDADGCREQATRRRALGRALRLHGERPVDLPPRQSSERVEDHDGDGHVGPGSRRGGS